MEARIIGSEEELGDVRGGLVIFGHELTRDWSDIGDAPAQLTKLEGNRFVELRAGGSAATEEAPALPKPAVIAALTELGVEHDPKTSVAALRERLAAAEAAQAASEKEAQA